MRSMTAFTSEVRTNPLPTQACEDTTTTLQPALCSLAMAAAAPGTCVCVFVYLFAVCAD